MYEVGKTNICPNCKVANRFENVTEIRTSGRISFSSRNRLSDGDSYSDIKYCSCPSCNQLIVTIDDKMIYPRTTMRDNAPNEVPEAIRNDYNEACLVETLSTKASAALARRCLQNMLIDKGITGSDLNKQIEQAITLLPEHLASSIDAIRNIGNFAAHPIKYQHTGEIIEVEEQECEWSLEVLSELFDFYYVGPAKNKTKKDELNNKLKNAKKPEMK